MGYLQSLKAYGWTDEQIAQYRKYPQYYQQYYQQQQQYAQQYPQQYAQYTQGMQQQPQQQQTQQGQGQPEAPPPPPPDTATTADNEITAEVKEDEKGIDEQKDGVAEVKTASDVPAEAAKDEEKSE